MFTDEQIHAGLDAYAAYLSKCRQMPSTFKAGELCEIMASFEKILFQHLDEEVESLKGERERMPATLSSR